MSQHTTPGASGDAAALRRQSRRLVVVFAAVTAAFTAADGSLYPASGWVAFAVAAAWFVAGVARVEWLCLRNAARARVTYAAVVHYLPVLLVSVLLPLAVSTGLLG